MFYGVSVCVVEYLSHYGVCVSHTVECVSVTLWSVCQSHCGAVLCLSRNIDKLKGLTTLNLSNTGVREWMRRCRGGTSGCVTDIRVLGVAVGPVGVSPTS